MAGCGYVCPVCEGRTYLDDGTDCKFCIIKSNTKTVELSDQEWIDSVHNSNCCSDIGKREE